MGPGETRGPRSFNWTLTLFTSTVGRSSSEKRRVFGSPILKKQTTSEIHFSKGRTYSTYRSD